VATSFSQLTVPLEGSFFGVDFNPAANALRIISDTGQNALPIGGAFPVPMADIAVALKQ